jgi:trk system potassium uptake protein TrkH
LATRRQYARSCKVRDGFLLVVLAWAVLPAFATAAAAALHARAELHRRLFRGGVGLTTTGATVL